VIVAVAKAGDTIHARGYGAANLEHGIALTPETVSESGSVAKQFTAAAVALLAVRGQLSLDDSIRKHLPEMPAALADAITVRMLLNHTSGLRDIHGLFDLLGRPSYTSFHDQAEVLRVMSRQRRLNFSPGTEYLYCNASYALAAIIVERVGGARFNTFCERELFHPRGMVNTRWRDDFAAIVPRRAAAYEAVRGGGYRLDVPYSNLVGNGGLLTTVGDLLRWNASLDAATGEWAQVVRLLQTRSRLKDGREIEYALGLTVDDLAGVPQISHGGATSGYRTFLTRFPDRGVSIAVLANVGSFDAAAAARDIARLVLPLPAAPRAAPPPVAAGEEISSLAGLYHCAQTDDLVRLTVRNGRLALGNTAWVATGPRTFASGSGRSTFEFAATAAGAPRRFTATSPNGVVTYVAVAPARPTPQELAAYAGTYHSEELDVTRQVEVQEGKLVFSRWPAVPVTATPTFADGFQVSPAWHATFVRDARGKVTGVELSNGRCRRVEFVRR
jgi:CubicO group peptidase (beta-lactamase class C family)